MKLASILVALGVLLGGMIVAPHLLYSLSWDLSLLALAAWIALAPFLMARVPVTGTNAGWLASIGFSSATVFLGCLAAIAGLYFSATAIPVAAEVPDVEVGAAPASVVSQILGAEVTADLAAETPGLVLTRVAPGARAESMGLEEGNRILAVNGTPVADAENDPLVLEARRAQVSADSVARAADSVRIALERDRQLLDLARQRLMVLRGDEAGAAGDPAVAATSASAAAAQGDSVLALELRINEQEAQAASLAAASTALRSRQQEVEAVLESPSYVERRDRRERLMFTRLARELRKGQSGDVVQLRVQAGDSVRVVELDSSERPPLTYSAIGLAALIIGTAGAVGLSAVSKKGVEQIQTISEAKAFESRHTVWQRQLLGAAAATSDQAIAKELTACAETVRYAGRDPSADGTPFNTRIDEVVQTLCRTPAPSGAEIVELSGTLRSLIVQRENAIREQFTRIAHTRP